jgi:hypothetical protein
LLARVNSFENKGNSVDSVRKFERMFKFLNVGLEVAWAEEGAAMPRRLQAPSRGGYADASAYCGGFLMPNFDSL